jgi:hypothetical protein
LSLLNVKLLTYFWTLFFLDTLSLPSTSIVIDLAISVGSVTLFKLLVFLFEAGNKKKTILD